MSTRKMLIAFVTVLLLAASFAGLDAWKAYAQGPDGDNPPCGGYGSGWNTQGGWNNQQGMMGHMGGMMHSWDDWDDCDYGYQMGSMMGGQGMMGGWNNQGNWGMMDGWNNQGNWTDPGMMNGQNGYPYMGSYGMMGGWTPPAALTPAGTTLSLDEAVAVADAYIAAQNNSNLALGEVLQFSNHFYAQAVEVDGGRGAFEFLIDPATGAVYPEPGPNMMWNVRYGIHGGSGMGMMGMGGFPIGADGVELTVLPDQARESAQQFLDAWYSGLTVASEADTFYGYYTFEVLQGDAIVGMLSVNGYTGQAWVHTWHGDFVAATGAAD